MATIVSDTLPRSGGVGSERAGSWSSLIALGLVPLAVIAAGLTTAIVTGVVHLDLTAGSFDALLIADTVIGVSLAALVLWRLIRVWSERRGRSGPRLHARLVGLFVGIAVVPAVLVAIFAVLALDRGLSAWFSPRVETAIGNALNVAQHYMFDQRQGIVLDAGTIADGIQFDGSLRDQNRNMVPSKMFEKLAMMTRDRGLTASFLVDSQGNVLGSATKIKYNVGIKPSAGDLADAAKGQIVIDGNVHTGVIHALIQLPVLNDAYLLVVRQLDPKVFGYYQRTKLAVGEYQRLQQTRGRLEILLAVLYLVVCTVLLLGAIWFGLSQADSVVRPISVLIDAAERVSGGDLKAQVPIGADNDEISTLSDAFNRMTSQLDAQRTALVEANRQNVERRRFTETVLAGVSAGVLGLDAEGRITIVNRAAARLLNAASEEIEGRHYAEAVPEFAGLIRKALSEPAARAGGEVTIKRAGAPRQLSVQVSSERGSDDSGYVVTFDDITDLVSAQRTAAWADVARRIAHEIKNPLTPIQLSAERLKRKYSKEVVTDPDVFEQCTDTIIRQVGDIGRMVDEFSSFARMPSPVMRHENAQELVAQAAFLQRVANPLVAFETKMPKDPVRFDCDGRLVAQALTNVLKNACESIAARQAKGDDGQGVISIALAADDETVTFAVTDNGIGLPPEHRHRLTEPYVTTRAKGTGLGLAIVRKILEDHGGDLKIADAGNDQPGAEVKFVFPRQQKTVKEKGIGDEQTRLAHRS